MFSGTVINVNEIDARMADLRKRRKAVLNEREIDALSTQEKATLNGIDSQLGFCGEQLREHKTGSYFTNSRQPGEFRLVAGEETAETSHKKTISRFLQGMFKEATMEQQEEIRALAGYLRGQPLAANLSPSADGVLVPTFVASAVERIYSALHPVVDVARIFGTDTGATTTFPVIDDSVEAEQLSEIAESGADDFVTGDAPPTLTGPQLKAWKISSKPVLVGRELFTDSDIDIVSEVVAALLARIIRLENKLYTVGDGVTGPQGFLHCTNFEGTGTLDLDGALDLTYAVGALFRPDGVYMMSDGTAKFLRKIKTGLSGDKRTIWTDYNQREGTPATLHGYPVKINPAMTDVNSDGTYGGGLSSVLAFGAFNRFVVRQAEQGRAFLYRYQVPRRDGIGVIMFRRSDSRLLASGAVAKLDVGSS
jgi:HK97 family phage major capsid protein